MLLADGPLITTYIPPIVPEAHAEVVIPIEWTPERIEEEARTVATRYGIDEWAFVETLRCESIGFTWNDQSLVKDPEGPNGREPSYGIPQFYQPSSLKTAQGEVITKEIALDIPQALDAAGYNFSVGNASHWTCFRNL